MALPITDLEVSVNEAEEHNLLQNGFEKIDVDLSSGVGENSTFLWYKRGNSQPITRIQLSFNNMTDDIFKEANYVRINNNINAHLGGNDIFLWIHRGTTAYDIPIVELHVVTHTNDDVDDDDARYFHDGWERLACDLNRGNDEDMMFLFLKRKQTPYICDITATAGFDNYVDLLQNGYIRLDEDINQGAGGDWVFIWYRHTNKPNRMITNLLVSDNPQHPGYQQVAQNLKQGLGKTQMFLCFTGDEDEGNPIRAITLIPERVREVYQGAGVHVVLQNFVTEMGGGFNGFLCFS